jgi:single-strand DNA-binding protein
MSSINMVLLLGNVGTVEVKDYAEDKSLVQLSLATQSGYKKGDDWVNETEWHRCIFAIPSLAERAKNIQVGDTIEVRGSIKTNKWTDKEGNEKSLKEISVVSFTTHKKAAKKEDAEEHHSEGAPAPAISGNDDDLPF